MRVGARLLGLVAVVTLLITGCSSTVTEELDASLSGIAGVDSVYVDETRVKATLSTGIAAAQAEAAVVALRDRSVAEHPLGADVELVVVITAGPRDFGAAQPWEVYSYALWTDGAVAGEGFAQQAAFFARLAEWESLLTTPAQVRRVQFTVSGIDSEVLPPEGEGVEGDGAGGEATDGEAEGATGDAPATDETPGTGEGTETVEPTFQTRTVRLDQMPGAENVPTDIEALIAELAAFWAEVGGLPEDVDIS